MKKFGILVVSLVVLGCGATEPSSLAMGKSKPTRPGPVDPPPAPASAEVSLVSSGGTGCPQGSSNALVTTGERGERVIAIATPSYAAELTESKRSKRLERLSCNLSIGVASIPAGQRAVVSKVLVIGNSDLEAGVSAKVTAESFLPGSTGALQSVATGLEDQDTLDALLLESNETVATPCGADAGIVRLNTNLVLSHMDSRAAARNSSAAIQSITLVLRTEACE